MARKIQKDWKVLTAPLQKILSKEELTDAEGKPEERALKVLKARWVHPETTAL